VFLSLLFVFKVITMRWVPLFLIVLIMGIVSFPVHGQDREYVRQVLEEAMRINPPGDYPPLEHRRVSLSESPKGSLPTPESINALFSKEVEPSDKDASVLLDEAPLFLSQGRYDLAIKRCKQILVRDPDNLQAKAKLDDIRRVLLQYARRVNPAAFE